jgi:hypothetical protein
MPPQQSERPLDLVDDGLDFRAHEFLRSTADVAICGHGRNPLVFLLGNPVSTFSAPALKLTACNMMR